VFVTRGEADLFLRLAPGLERNVHVVENGCEHRLLCTACREGFAYAANEAPIVFTGAMDYWPNIDAVAWFASEVLPRVLARGRTRASTSSA